MEKTIPRVKIDSEQYISEKTNRQIKDALEQISEKKQEIKYDTRDYPVKYLVEEFLNDLFFVPEEYQRRFIWKNGEKSYFIESLLMGLPIPFMFFSDSNDGRIEIVDGAQRTQTLVEFVTNELELEGLKLLTSLNGFKFGDLEESLQRRFLNISIRVVFLDEGTTVKIRQEIFSRINTGGKELEPIESRRGAYEGTFMEFVKKCTENELLNRLAPRTDQTETRFEGMELVIRFFAYSDNYADNYIGYDGSVRNYLDEYVEKKTTEFDTDENLKEVYAEKLNSMLLFAEKMLGDLGFRKTKKAKSTPRARFEALSIGIALALSEKPDLEVPKDMAWLESEEFKKHTRSDASNNKRRLVGRIEYVKHILLKENNE